MTRYGVHWMVLLLGGLALATAGCGRAEFTFVPVEGTVTKGGRPLRDVEVIFLADRDAGTVGQRASGVTDEAGHYRLRAANGDDGAVVGKHRVVILDREAAEKQLLRSFRGKPSKNTGQPSPEMAPRLQDQRQTAADAPRVPPGYGRINETPLRAEVRPGEQFIDFEVK
jgi:hypothetical protein